MNQSMYMQHSHYDISVNNRREWIYRNHELYLEKDYVNPDDYEYEPTPHATVLKRAESHYTSSETQESDEKQPEAKK